MFRIMLKIFVLFAFIGLLSIPSYALSLDVQATGQPSARIDAIETRRIAFLTERIGLTPEEAMVFWPIYNQNRQKREEISNSFRTRWGQVKKVSDLSPEDAALLAEDQVRRVEQLTTLKRRFHEDLKRIISPMKIALLYEAERDFNRILFQEARRNDGERDGRDRR